MTARMIQGLAVTTLAVALAGCASMESMRRKVTEVFSGEKKEPAPTAERGQVYYVGRDGLKLYDKPSASSTVLATLSRNQQVTRYGMERGYANVEVTETRVRGWVDNAQLAVRKVSAPQPVQADRKPATEPSAPAPPPAASDAAPAPAEAAPAQPAEASADTAASAQPPPPPPPAAPIPAKAPDAVTPAVFDPF